MLSWCDIVFIAVVSHGSVDSTEKGNREGRDASAVLLLHACFSVFLLTYSSERCVKLECDGSGSCLQQPLSCASDNPCVVCITYLVPIRSFTISSLSPPPICIDRGSAFESFGCKLLFSSTYETYLSIFTPVFSLFSVTPVDPPSLPFLQFLPPHLPTHIFRVSA